MIDAPETTPEVCGRHEADGRPTHDSRANLVERIEEGQVSTGARKTGGDRGSLATASQASGRVVYGDDRNLLEQICHFGANALKGFGPKVDRQRELIAVGEADPQ